MRRGFNLIELLVVIALIAVLVGLLMPAILKVREVANTVVCRNNLKQIGLAVHNYVTTFDSLPTEGGAPAGPGNSASVFFNLLPYLEQNAVYSSFAGQSVVIKVFLCPSDPTGTGVPTTTGPAASLALGSYNYNLWEAGVVNGGVFPTLANPPMQLHMVAAMPDGASNTILAGEHVQDCGSAGGGMSGQNPWATTANKRFVGSLPLAQGIRPIALNVSSGDCGGSTGLGTPPRGVALFSTGHVSSVLFLMGDGAVQGCPLGSGGLPAALTAAAGDVFEGF